MKGSLTKVLYDQMIAEGVELPVERPGKDIVMCLLEINSPRIWVDYEPARVRPMASKAWNDGSSLLSRSWEPVESMEMYFRAAERFYEARCD